MSEELEQISKEYIWKKTASLYLCDAEISIPDLNTEPMSIGASCLKKIEFESNIIVTPHDASHRFTLP